MRAVLIFSTVISLIPRLFTSWIDANAYSRSKDSKSFFPGHVWLVRSRWLSALWTNGRNLLPKFFQLRWTGFDRKDLQHLQNGRERIGWVSSSGNDSFYRRRDLISGVFALKRSSNSEQRRHFQQRSIPDLNVRQRAQQ